MCGTMQDILRTETQKGNPRGPRVMERSELSEYGLGLPDLQERK